MRQPVTSWEHPWRGNAPSHPDCRAIAFTKLEDHLLSARRQYEGVKQLDEALFGNELDAA